ncbi:autotransporter assembly complex family protein [Acidiphilium sp. AL]|uniref:autotransporter assembly complex protein TamA n=1 Tax=Acidiphilium sp. AL TaxID=2871704 RepID=UPI0021CB6321|nr:BamA/TamA family outer membrane protein [Acidiphilium sp. AL]
MARLPFLPHVGMMEGSAGRKSRVLGALGTVIVAVAFAGPARAADPQPYRVTFVPSGDKTLDKLIKQTSGLERLRKKLPIGPFALIGRARADQAKFVIVLESEGYDSGTAAITIDGHGLTDSALPRLLRRAPASPPADVIVTIHKGPLYHIGSIETPGLTDPAAAQAIDIKPGDPAKAAPVLAAAAKLEIELRNSGYAFAKVSEPVAIADTAHHTLAVHYPVAMGQRVAIGAITYTGMQHMNGRFMARHVALRPGQPYSETALNNARDSLLGLGVFSSVATHTGPAPDPPGQVPVTFLVHEQKLHAVSIGAAYSTDLGIDADLSWMDRNLFGEAQRLTLSLGATGLAGSGRSQTRSFGKHTYVIRPGYNAKAVYRVPDFLTPGQSITATVEALKEYLPAYSRTAFLGNAEISRPLGKHLAFVYGAGFIFEKVSQEGVDRTYRLGQVPLTLRYDTTNSLLNPTKGMKLSLHVTPTLALGAGSSTFIIAEAIGNTYIDLEAPGRGVLALRGLIGRIFGASQFQIPPDQRFYAGGTGTVRGFTYQTVGPLFFDGIPEGGTAIDAVETEFRQRIGKHFGIAPFVDAGQVSANGKPFSGTLRVGAGLGFLYYTGIGPIRIDVGFPMNRPPGGASVAVYIGLGQAF